MEIRAIETEQEYDDAVARLEKLMSAEFGSPEGEELDALATVIVAYEEVHFPMDPPDPVAAEEFRRSNGG